MIKQAPSRGKILGMVLFALSCFGILVFLWRSFGGPLPLEANGYRVKVAFPEAVQLADQADVRISGVPVGKVVDRQLDKARNATVATIELRRRYAPIPVDTKAILRQKSLIGETYVELTPGSRDGPKLADGGRLPDAQVKSAVQLDEVFKILDAPTRHALQDWQQQLGKALGARGADVNATLGNLPELTDSGTELLAVMNDQAGAVRALVRDTGQVFSAISSREDRLRTLVTSSSQVFDATARRQQALADAIAIVPTFMGELRTTLDRAQSFAADADPLVTTLTPAVTRLRPALGELHAAAPDLRSLALDVPPLASASKQGLPAASDVLSGARPVLGATGPLLSEINPILQWLEYDQRLTIGLFNAPAGLNYTVPGENKDTVGHVLRAFSPAGLESISVWPQRLPTNRGNTYLSPVAHSGPKLAHYMIQPSWDCNNTGRGQFVTAKHDTNDAPSCWVDGFPNLAPPGQLPHVQRADYSRP